MPRRLPAVALLAVLPLLQALAPVPAGPPGQPVRIVSVRVPEAAGFEIPQVVLADTGVAGRINEAIVAAMLTAPADLDPIVNRDLVRALRQARAACCTTEDGLAQPGQGLTAAGYQVLFNDGRLLCLEFNLEMTGAYSYGSAGHTVFAVATGRQPALTDIVAEPPPKLRQRLRWAINRRIKETLADALEEGGPELVASLAERFDWDAKTGQVRFENEQFPSLNEFSVSDKGITLFYNAWLPPSLWSHAPEASYFFSFDRLPPKPAWRYLNVLPRR